MQTNILGFSNGGKLSVDELRVRTATMTSRHGGTVAFFILFLEFDVCSLFLQLHPQSHRPHLAFCAKNKLTITTAPESRFGVPSAALIPHQRIARRQLDKTLSRPLLLLHGQIVCIRRGLPTAITLAADCVRPTSTVDSMEPPLHVQGESYAHSIVKSANLIPPAYRVTSGRGRQPVEWRGPNPASARPPLTRWLPDMHVLPRSSSALGVMENCLVKLYLLFRKYNIQLSSCEKKLRNCNYIINGSLEYSRFLRQNGQDSVVMRTLF